MPTYTPAQLTEILSQHRLWFADEGGQRANLSGADLRGADLSGCMPGGVDFVFCTKPLPNLIRKFPAVAMNLDDAAVVGACAGGIAAWIARGGLSRRKTLPLRLLEGRTNDESVWLSWIVARALTRAGKKP